MICRIIQKPITGLDQFIQLAIRERRELLVSTELIVLTHRNYANIGNICSVLRTRLIRKLAGLKRVAGDISFIIKYRARFVADFKDLVARVIIFKISAISIGDGHDALRQILRGRSALRRFPSQRILTG